MARGAAVLVAATLLLLFSMAIPWQPLFQTALALYALLVFCLLWIANGWWGLRFNRPAPVSRGQVGQLIHDAFVMSNSAFLPKLGLEVRDHSTLPGHQANGVMNLRPRQRAAGELDTESELRGLYTLGPTGAAMTDPFGLFTLERRIGPSSELLIYPETVDLGNFTVPGTIITEGARRRRPTQMQTLDPAGTRPYVFGDSQRRIHWLSSAHAGQLMVKEFEFTPDADVWIFLDLEKSVHIGSGLHSTEEYAITTAASVAAHYIGGARSVGLVTSTRGEQVLPADRGARQQTRILEHLAMVKANGRVPLQEMLWMERSRLGRSSTAVVITPSLDDNWTSALAQIKHGGTRTAVLLVEGSTFGAAPAATMQVAALTAVGIPTFLIKRSASHRAAIQEGLLQSGDGGASR